jgi:hypothetical protein
MDPPSPEHIFWIHRGLIEEGNEDLTRHDDPVVGGLWRVCVSVCVLVHIAGLLPGKRCMLTWCGYWEDV